MKTLLLVVGLYLGTLPLVAQFPEYGIGVRVGTTWSMLMSEPALSQSVLPTTFHAGAQFRMVSEKYFGIIVELNYVQRGFADNNKGVRSHRRLDYIELPFLAHITFGRKLFRYFIDLGPTVSCLLSDTKASPLPDLPQHTMPVKNFVDYGIAAGTGFEFNTRYGIYTIDARYSFGLGNLFSSKPSDAFRSSSNHNITLSLAYLFPF